MNVPDWLQESVVTWTPALGVLLAGIVLLLLLRYFLGRRPEGPGVLTVLSQLFMLLATAALVVAIILALPIGETARGQLLTLLGLLSTAAIALASTTFLGNAMAGLMLRAIRSFRPGDFVRIEAHFGRVSETGLLHTEIQTEDGDLTTLPNLLFATHAVTVVRASGTIISATVSLGYDVHRELVEATLLEAATNAALKEPFVLVSDLGDHAVTYRVAGLLEEVKTLISTRSRLRSSMLDALHGADIEIVSPSFMNQRQLAPRERVVPPDQAGPPPPLPPMDEFLEERIFDKAEAAAEKAALDEDISDEPA